MWLTILGVYLIVGGIFGAWLVGEVSGTTYSFRHYVEVALVGGFLWLPIWIVAAFFGVYPFIRRK